MPSSKKGAKRGGSSSDKDLPSQLCKKKTSTPQKRVKKGNIRISVVTFAAEFKFEAYYVEKPNGDQAYVNHLKEYVQGKLTEKSAAIDGINIVDYCNWRIPNTDNKTMTTAAQETYPKNLFIVYPKENETTEATREKGLAAMKNFLMDPTFTRYPAEAVDVIDLTDEAHPPALDEYFMDRDIQKFMEEDLSVEVLDSTFATKFPAFARKCWRFNFISDWGMYTLGFDNLINQKPAAST